MGEHLPGTHRFNLQHHHPQLKRKRKEKKKETIMEKNPLAAVGVWQRLRGQKR